MYPSTATVEWG